MATNYTVQLNQDLFLPKSFMNQLFIFMFVFWICLTFPWHSMQSTTKTETIIILSGIIQKTKRHDGFLFKQDANNINIMFVTCEIMCVAESCKVRNCLHVIFRQLINRHASRLGTGALIFINIYSHARGRYDTSFCCLLSLRPHIVSLPRHFR